ncbi:MAG: DUF6112 family protein [Acidimicrobiales bacterium]
MLFESFGVQAAIGMRQTWNAIMLAAAGASTATTGAGSTGATGTSGAGQVSFFTPKATGLPGINELHSLTNGLGAWAMILALAGLVIGAAAWALGSHSQNYHQSVVGRRAVLVSGAAALLIGAAPGIIGFFFNAGKGVQP